MSKTKNIRCDHTMFKVHEDMWQMDESVKPAHSLYSETEPWNELPVSLWCHKNRNHFCTLTVTEFKVQWGKCVYFWVLATLKLPALPVKRVGDSAMLLQSSFVTGLVFELHLANLSLCHNMSALSPLETPKQQSLLAWIMCGVSL